MMHSMFIFAKIWWGGDETEGTTIEGWGKNDGDKVDA